MTTEVPAVGPERQDQADYRGLVVRVVAVWIGVTVVIIGWLLSYGVSVPMFLGALLVFGITLFPALIVFFVVIAIAMVLRWRVPSDPVILAVAVGVAAVSAQIIVHSWVVEAVVTLLGGIIGLLWVRQRSGLLRVITALTLLLASVLALHLWPAVSQQF